MSIGSLPIVTSREAFPNHSTWQSKLPTFYPWTSSYYLYNPPKSVIILPTYLFTLWLPIRRQVPQGQGPIFTCSLLYSQHLERGWYTSAQKIFFEWIIPWMTEDKLTSSVLINIFFATGKLVATYIFKKQTKTMR